MVSVVVLILLILILLFVSAMLSESEIENKSLKKSNEISKKSIQKTQNQNAHSRRARLREWLRQHLPGA